jgi:long-chain acyl-CoA synthetase
VTASSSTRHRHDEPVDFAVIERRPASLAQLFLNRVSSSGSAEAFRYPHEGGWRSSTWRDVGARTELIAAGLIALGVGPQDRVALAAATRYEWVLADFGISCCGAATTTVYPTTSGDDVAFIVSDSGSRVVIAEDGVQLAKLAEHRSELPEVVAVVVIDGVADGDWVLTLADLERRGADLLAGDPHAVSRRVAAIRPEHLSTLMYTSGTTGRPKGVRLAHSALTYEVAAVDSLGFIERSDVQYLWLPLSHVFGKLMIALPVQIGFATVIDGRAERIVHNLPIVRPTFMAAAPRVFEKVHAGVNAAVRAEGGVKARVFGWAVGVGNRVATLRREQRPVPRSLAVRHVIADRLVLSKVRDRFGGRLRFFVSGSAALNPEIAEWFDAIGIVILEGYGLTETMAASFCNRAGRHRFGTVGWAYPGTEVRIAEDGEIQLRGPGVMDGYHNRPDETAAVLDGDGWFSTGDIGLIDNDGYLRITDRKKDLFKTSNGKYVAPGAIESMFKGICPIASQLVVHGENRHYVTGLVTLDPEALGAWSAANGLTGLSYAELTVLPQVRVLVAGYVDELNRRLNRWEAIKRFDILERDLTVADGELTPSLKLRRRVVAEKFADRLDRLY